MHYTFKTDRRAVDALREDVRRQIAMLGMATATCDAVYRRLDQLSGWLASKSVTGETLCDRVLDRVRADLGEVRALIETTHNRGIYIAGPLPPPHLQQVAIYHEQVAVGIRRTERGGEPITAPFPFADLRLTPDGWLSMLADLDQCDTIGAILVRLEKAMAVVRLAQNAFGDSYAHMAALREDSPDHFAGDGPITQFLPPLPKVGILAILKELDGKSKTGRSRFSGGGGTASDLGSSGAATLEASTS